MENDIGNEVNLLIVEDSPTQAVAIQYLLEEEGYKVSMAVDGEQALAMLKEITPDIIISDIVMPKMNGYELCTKIKEDKRLSDIPVILLTSLSNPEDVINGLVCGANNFIVKPFEKRFLLSRIRYILINRELRQNVSSQAGIEIYFRDKRYFLSNERVQMIDLLLSTYEAAIQKNRDFEKVNQELEQTKDELETRVKERTAELLKSNVQLQKEIEERKHIEKALRRSENELAIKNQISQAFTTSPGDELFRNISQIFLNALKSKHGILGYINEDGDMVCPSLTENVWETGKIPDKDIIFRRKSWPHSWGRAINEMKILFFNEPFLVPEGHIKITGALIVPIIYDGRAIGNLLVGNKETGDFGQSDVRLMASIASHLAPLLNARLLRDKQEKKRKTLENQLRHTQKMEAIGTLAGGIAHDFNNILTSLLGFTQLIMMDVKKGTKTEEDLQEVYKSGLRAKELVRQILTFARKSEEVLMSIRLDLIVKEVLKFIRSSIPANIDIKDNIQSKSLVMANATQIHQVVMNLCTNASHAMNSEGGVLEITLKDIVVDHSQTQFLDGITPGEFIELTVSDTGSGIPDAILDRIFEPYFTTKNIEEGTGMGLALVQGIVKDAKGVIKVESHINQGTTFKIFFPVTNKKKSSSSEINKKLVKGKGHVLVVDDEEPIIKLSKRFLEGYGYTVTTAIDPEEALRIFSKNANDFDAVITDLTMPKMNGNQLIKKIQDIRPGIPCVLCTGYSRESNRNSESNGATATLIKPVGQNKLVSTIQHLLE